MSTAYLLDAFAAVSVATALTCRPVWVPSEDRRRRSWWGEPGLWLLIVVAAIVVNQVLFTVYVLRVHHGDASFIARYLPRGWFVLADDGPMRSLAAAVPDPGLLAVTVLRTRSFLELPFALLAVWTAVRWLDERVLRALLRPRALWATAIGYDVAFMLIEAHFATPYRSDDLIIRGVSGLVTPLVAGVWAARFTGRRDRRASGPAGLAAFAVSALALGGFVLVLYDTVLLYNLGRVGADAPIALGCAAILLVARIAVGRIGTETAGPYVSLLLEAVRGWFGWFVICALPIRYLISYGSRVEGVALAFLVGVLVLVRADRVVGLTRRQRWVVATVSGVAAVTGAVVIGVLPLRYAEANVLAGAAVALALVTIGLVLLDRWSGVRPEPISTGS
jgi:hypothetical protein